MGDSGIRYLQSIFFQFRLQHCHFPVTFITHLASGKRGVAASRPDDVWVSNVYEPGYEPKRMMSIYRAVGNKEVRSMERGWRRCKLRASRRGVMVPFSGKAYSLVSWQDHTVKVKRH